MTTTPITITGNAEVRTTPTGKATARLRVAVHRRTRNAAGTWSEQTDWHTVIAWGTLAEAAADLRKGHGVIVHGRLAQRATGSVRNFVCGFGVTSTVSGRGLEKITHEDAD